MLEASLVNLSLVHPRVLVKIAPQVKNGHASLLLLLNVRLGASSRTTSSESLPSHLSPLKEFQNLNKSVKRQSSLPNSLAAFSCRIFVITSHAASVVVEYVLQEQAPPSSSRLPGWLAGRVGWVKD